MLMLEQKIFKASHDSLKNPLYLQKFNISLGYQDYERSYFELRRVREKYINDSLIESNFYWNAALISKLSNEFQYANIFYDAYIDFTNDTGSSSLLLGMLIKSDLDSSAFYKFIDQYEYTSHNEVSVCFETLLSYQLKRKWTYILSSYLVPGSGTILSGDLYNGIGSLVTVSGFSFGVSQLVKSKLYFGAGIWGYLFLPRVYFGNIRLTVAKIQELEKKKKLKLAYSCEQKVKELLNNNPIDFRLNE